MERMCFRWTLPVSVLVVAILGAGCARTHAPTAGAPVLRVLCTTFPMYLMTKNVAAGRDEARVEIMLPAAMGCPHDYVLTPQDLQKIAGADLLIANGLDLEEFLGDQVSAANARLAVVDTSRGIGDVLYATEAGAAGSSRRIRNPHAFASPALAAIISRNIAEALAAADPAGAPAFARNAEAYAARLTGLATACREVSAALPSRRIVTEHAVFDYFARDCGLEIAAVVEETPGQEPAAARMLQLVAEIRRSGAAALFTEPQYQARVGRTIAREAGIPDAALDPVASGPDDPPLDYYERVMRQNFETLRRTIR
jgi:ABC-type Zn uptake system ZnuABC Zn-binding protein ZnuA